jgi:hypothetical protein
MRLYRSFHQEVVARTQLNAGFYAGAPAPAVMSQARQEPHEPASNEETLDRRIA